MSSTGSSQRSLSVPALVGILAIYLLIVQGGAILLLAGADFNYGEFPTTEAIIRATSIPVGLSLLFAIAVTTWLGWWDQVLHEHHRVGRWAWIFPGLMIASMLLATDYAQLGKVGAGMVLTLAVTMLLVGATEELMFRGITLESMRRVPGTTEIRAALWTAVLFGGVHVTNIFAEGPGALGQAVIVSVSGLFFYLSRRVSGGLVIPILLHAGWDFSLFSASLGPDPDIYALAGVGFLANVAMAIILFVRRRDIWPSDEVATPA